jgi:hypothetical protein
LLSDVLPVPMIKLKTHLVLTQVSWRQKLYDCLTGAIDNKLAEMLNNSERKHEKHFASK